MTIVCTDMDNMTRTDSANNRRYWHDDSHIQLFHLSGNGLVLLQMYKRGVHCILFVKLLKEKFEKMIVH